jgi:hypothetical protein
MVASGRANNMSRLGLLLGNNLCGAQTGTDFRISCRLIILRLVRMSTPAFQILEKLLLRPRRTRGSAVVASGDGSSQHPLIGYRA